MSEPMTTIEIKISRIIHEDGQLAFRVVTPQHYSAIEVLGLLEGAKWQIFRQMTSGAHDDEF